MMQSGAIRFPPTPIALKMAVAVGIGMLVGLEREWSNKDVGIRTFAIVSVVGMLAALMGQNIMVTSLIGVFLLVGAMNGRSVLTNRSLEITTSAALIGIYLLGCLVGLGHVFTPVAGAVVITMLLAWKTELSRFAGGLQPSEIRSAVLLGLIGFVIYPALPNRYVDPWKLFNPSDAWISVIAIAGIGFVNYVLLRMYSAGGLYLGAMFGGMVNSTATIAELGLRVAGTEMVTRISSLCLLTTIAMFARNLLLAALFAPRSLTATSGPLVAMMLTAGFWVWRERFKEKSGSAGVSLASPIALGKVLRFGLLFIGIQISGTLLTRLFGNSGMFAVAMVGGLVSSASTTAAAATMAMHGQISPSVAGSAAVVASLASAAINLPIVWRTTRDRRILRLLIFEMATVMLAGIVMVLVDRRFQFSEMLTRK